MSFQSFLTQLSTELQLQFMRPSNRSLDSEQCNTVPLHHLDMNVLLPLLTHLPHSLTALHMMKWTLLNSGCAQSSDDVKTNSIDRFIERIPRSVTEVSFASLEQFTIGYTPFFSTLVLYRIVLYCIVLYCIVLYCIVLYCIVLYCIVLY